MILPECPLGLNANRAKKCECKKRVSHVTSHDLRVTTCTWPRDWRGGPVSRVNNIQKVEFDMSAAEATEVKGGEFAWKRVDGKVLWTDGPGEPFWGMVNGKPLRIRTFGATGPFGSGKSLLGDMIDPRNTLKIDIESSSTSFNLPFKKHLVMYEEVQTKNASGIPSSLECFLWFQSLLQNVEAGVYSVINIDPFNEIQQGAYDWVTSNPKLFGRTAGQYEKMTALAWGDVKNHLDMLIGRAAANIETFYYTVHLGQVWKDGKPVEGKYKAKGSDVFRKIADLFVCLDRPMNPKTGEQMEAPIGVVAPPIGKSRLTHANPDTGEILSILPPAVHGMTPAKIRAYIAKPPNYKKLKKDELVPIHELTDDEKLLIKADIAANERESEELRNGRLDAMAAAAKANKEARAAVATDATRTEANESPKDEPKDTVPPKDGPSSVNVQTAPFEPDPADLPLADADRVEIIKQQFKERMFSKEQMIAAIQKHGGPGAKLAGLTSEQLAALQGENWTALTKKAMETGK